MVWLKTGVPFQLAVHPGKCVCSSELGVLTSSLSFLVDHGLVFVRPKTGPHARSKHTFIKRFYSVGIWTGRAHIQRLPAPFRVFVLLPHCRTVTAVSSVRVSARRIYRNVHVCEITAGFMSKVSS